MNASIEDQIKIALYAMISSHTLRLKQCHMKYQQDQGNLLKLTSFQLITNIIFVLKIIIANS